jgi:hypothetical protein
LYPFQSQTVLDQILQLSQNWKKRYAAGKTHQFLLKSLQESIPAKNIVQHISVKANRQPERTWKELVQELTILER